MPVYLCGNPFFKLSRQWRCSWLSSSRHRPSRMRTAMLSATGHSGPRYRRTQLRIHIAIVSIGRGTGRQDITHQVGGTGRQAAGMACTIYRVISAPHLCMCSHRLSYRLPLLFLAASSHSIVWTAGGVVTSKTSLAQYIFTHSVS